jgi:hypothetical protein
VIDKPKHPFMPNRDGGGSFDLDNPADGSPIREMLSLSDRLLLVTEKCTYEVKLADQIDPKRTNPNLPHNVRRKLLDYGINSDELRMLLLRSCRGPAWYFRFGWTFEDSMGEPRAEARSRVAFQWRLWIWNGFD